MLCEQRGQMRNTLILRDRGEIGKFHFADDLDALRIEIFIKAHELEPRARNVIFRDQNIRRIAGAVKHLKPEFVDDLFECDGKAFSHNLASLL